VRLVRELAVVAVYAVGCALVGGSIGAVIFSICEWSEVLQYEFHAESLSAGITSALVGAGSAALMGLGWSARRWYGRAHPVVEAEDELW
jgi:hypothetical protein